MVCSQTWPNHRLRSDSEAVMAINNQMGIAKGQDVEYGRTKCKLYNTNINNEIFV